MITRVYRGSATAGLVRYLYGPGRHEDHTAAHMVASWDGSTVLLEPAGFDADKLSRGAVNAHATRIAKALDVPLAACEGHDPNHVYHLVLRNPEQDRLLSDAEWAAVGEDAMHRTGLAPRGDAGGCRWVMVRHGEDHVHLVATLARQDGQRPRLFRDFLRLRETAAAWEEQLDLTRTGTADKTAAKAPTLGETHKAERLAGTSGQDGRAGDPDREATEGTNGGGDEAVPAELGASGEGQDRDARPGQQPATGRPAPGSGERWTHDGAGSPRSRQAPWTTRERLARSVHTAAARSGGEEEFLQALQQNGVKVHFRRSERDGQITGVSFSLTSDSAGIRFGGGKLAPDLTWPKLQARWRTTTPAGPPGGDRTTVGERAWQEAERVVRDAAGRLHGDHPAPGEVDPGLGWAAGDAARGLAWLLEGDQDGPLHEAADDLARAGREPGGRIDDLTVPARLLSLSARALTLSSAGSAAQAQALILAMAALARSMAAVRRAQDRHAAADAALRAEQRLTGLRVTPPDSWTASPRAGAVLPPPPPPWPPPRPRTGRPGRSPNVRRPRPASSRPQARAGTAGSARQLHPRPAPNSSPAAHATTHATTPGEDGDLVSAEPHDEASRALASSFSQSVMFGVQMLEHGLRMQAERESRAAGAAREAGAQSRAARQEAYSLDRVRFSRAFDPQWLRQAGGQDLIEAWGAAARWADTSVQADTATRRVETQLRHVWPDQMRHYDDLRGQGHDRLTAMSAAAEAARLDAERGPLREGASAQNEEEFPVLIEQAIALTDEDPRLREARRGWSPAHDETWVAQAGPGDLDQAWRAAAVWADLDAGAETAATAIENRLRQLRPDVMDDFDTLRGAGLNRIEALWEATRSTTTFTPDADAQPDAQAQQAGGAWQAEADAHRVHADHAAARPDDPATAWVDEHREGQVAATHHDRAAADLHQRAAAASYPSSVATVVATVSTGPETSKPGTAPSQPVRPALTGRPPTPPPVAPRR